jgi:arylsulfatase A-like enzyme
MGPTQRSPLLGRAQCAQALLACAALLLSAACTPEPVNLLMISLDTTRADHLSLYGYPRRTTPRLEAFAREGVTFTQAYSATATTGPSHATLFTSLHPYTHGLLKNGIPLDESRMTLAEALAENGYATHGVLGSFALSASLGFAQGFESWDEDFAPETSTYEHEAWEGQAVAGGFDRRADDSTRRALAWLREREDDARPFFLFVHYFDPHDPYAPPERFRGHANVPPGPQRLRALYDGEIEFVDEQVGLLLNGLLTQRLAENTLVVVVGDHGEGLLERGGHLTHGKHIYEEGVHVPLLMRLPGTLPSGSVHRTPVGAIDLAPTILDLLRIEQAGIEPDGVSIADVIRRGAEPDEPRPVYLTRRRYDPRGRKRAEQPKGEQHAVRLAQWKYFETTQGAPPELYDLDHDPDERHNVAASHPERVKELAQLLRAWRARQSPADGAAAIPADVRAKLEAMGYAE